MAGGGHERLHGLPSTDAPLRWWKSVQLLGWQGGKVTGLRWSVAVDAHRRGVHGRRRQATLTARIDAELSDGLTLAARLTDPEACPSPPVARSFLLKVVGSGLLISDRRLQQAIGALARFAGEPAQLRQLARQLPHVDDLHEVAGRREGQVTVAVVDLEIDAAGKPFDVAVVLLRGVERVAARRWNAVTTELDEWVDGALLCAHNGEAHDAPILSRHGMRLDPPVLDSLRWFWLAAPLEAAHSLRELVDRYGDQQPERAWHTALADAEALAAALPSLRRAIQRLPASTRSALATALSGSVAPAVLAWMLDPPSTHEPWHHEIVVHAAPLFPPIAADRVVQTTSDLSAWTDETAGLIVDADRARCAARRRGWFLRGERLIDATALAAQSLSGGGWASAIALRLVDEAAGALPLWPPSATDLLYPAGDEGPPAVPVHDQPVVTVGVGPWSCEPDTVELAPEHAPIALIDAVDLLFGGSGPVPGVSAHPGPVTAVVTHAGPRRSGAVPQLWTRALGGTPSFVGTVATVDVEIILVTGLHRQPDGRRHLARVTGIAAGLSQDRSMVLVTNGDRRDLIAAALSGPWRTTTGTHLLRPGTWPTLREAAARLSSAPHLAVATPGVLPRLPVRCPTVIDRIGAPSPDHPLVAQMLSELGDGDPYGDVVEPIAALRLLRVLAATREQAYVLDPAAESPLVRSSLATGTGWRSVEVSALEGSARSITARDAIVRAAGSDEQTDRATLADVQAAARRLLPEAGQLHDFQRSVTTALVEGRDVLGVFRTGAGKSLCYQAAALAMSAAGQGCTLVVSPLPEQALAVCFNRAAADEMSVRLAALGVAGVRVATLNSVGNRIVNQHWPSLGFEKQPHLMASDPERLHLLREIIAEVCPEVAPRQWAQRIIKTIDLARSRMIAPEDYAEVAEPLRALGRNAPPSPTEVAAVYAAYLDAFSSRGVIDFLGQIELSIAAMTTVDEVRVAVTSSLREVFVDEAQDLTALDWRLVELLASGGRLTAVGDPRQAIYEWRGADPGQFTSFCGQNVLRDLRYNYRSSAEIVDVANQAMPSYPSLIPVTPEPGTVDERTVAEPVAPAVVEVLQHWLADGIPDDEIAVLVRRGDELDPILSAARVAGIACRGIDIVKLTSSPAYAVAMELLAEHDPEQDSEAGWSWSQVLRELVARDDVQEQLADAAEPDQDPLTDWNRLLDAILDLEADGPLTLREIDRRLRRRDRDAVPANGVTVSTIHKAKGMEWTAVAVIAHHDPRRPRAGEEQRLHYVAVTRAKRHLCVLSTTSSTTRLQSSAAAR